jgi:hypothetical protein
VAKSLEEKTLVIRDVKINILVTISPGAVGSIVTGDSSASRKFCQSVFGVFKDSDYRSIIEETALPRGHSVLVSFYESTHVQLREMAERVKVRSDVLIAIMLEWNARNKTKS